jgi:hypothetical protein
MKLAPTKKYCLLLAAAILLFYWRLFLPHQFTLLTDTEATNQAFSWFNFWITSLRHGIAPIWDPYSNAGYSFPGEMQTGAFYPLYLLLPFLPLNRDGMLSPMEYHAVFLFAHVLAGLFMFAFIRELKLSRFAAFVASFCFSTGGFVGSVGWPHLLQSSIWLPLTFLFMLRALKHSDKRRAIQNCTLSGATLGMSILAGGLHIAIAQVIVVVTALAFYAAQKHDLTRATDWLSRPWPRALFVGALVLTVALCAGAVQLLPSHLYAARSLRWYGEPFLGTEKPPYMYTIQSGLWPGALLSILFSSFDGMGYGEVWTSYVGVFPLIMAIFAVAKSWPHLWVRYLVFLALGATLYSFAALSALHGILYLLVPWLWLAHEATRFLYLAGFSLAVLAAFGIDLLLSCSFGTIFAANVKRALSWVIIGCLLIFCLPVLAPKLGSPRVYFSFFLILASSALLLFALSRNTSLGISFRMLVLVFIFFDLSGFNNGVGNKIEADKSGTDEYKTLLSLSGAVKYLKAQPQPFRVRVLRDPKPNIGDAFAIPSVYGAGVTLGVDFWRIQGADDLLNVRYFIKPASSADPGPVYEDGNWKIYENADPFPRSWLVHKLRQEPDDDSTFHEIYTHQLDLRHTALVTSPLREDITSASGAANESALLQSYSANRMSFAVDADGPALLVLSEIYYPEWQAFVNGEKVEIHKVNLALRSVVVPSGKSSVELVYRPWSVYIGAILSTLAFIAAFAALVFDRRSARVEASAFSGYGTMFLPK